MLEVGVLLLVTLGLVGVGLGVWRLLRGRARERRSLILRLVVLSLTVAPLVLLSVWRLSKSRSVQLCGEMVARVETSSPVVALTFDDGPAPGYTEEILEILRSEGVRATFFVTGQALEDHMVEASRIVAAGHELGNHSFSHARMIGRSLAFVREEVERTDALIRATGYEGDVHFRPPYGKRFVVLPCYLSATGRVTIFMDVEPESYPEIAGDTGRIVEHVLSEARPGSIVLLHVMNESRAATVRAVPEIVRSLRGRGYRFVTVSELLALRE